MRVISGISQRTNESDHTSWPGANDTSQPADPTSLTRRPIYWSILGALLGIYWSFIGASSLRQNYLGKKVLDRNVNCSVLLLYLLYFYLCSAAVPNNPRDRNFSFQPPHKSNKHHHQTTPHHTPFFRHALHLLSPCPSRSTHPTHCPSPTTTPPPLPIPPHTSSASKPNHFPNQPNPAQPSQQSAFNRIGSLQSHSQHNTNTSHHHIPPTGRVGEGKHACERRGPSGLTPEARFLRGSKFQLSQRSSFRPEQKATYHRRKQLKGRCEPDPRTTCKEEGQRSGSSKGYPGADEESN